MVLEKEIGRAREDATKQENDVDKCQDDGLLILPLPEVTTSSSPDCS